MNFGIIGEGVTDQEVIRNILYSYFDTDDLNVTNLIPDRDATDKSKLIKGARMANRS